MAEVISFHYNLILCTVKLNLLFNLKIHEILIQDFGFLAIEQT